MKALGDGVMVEVAMAVGPVWFKVQVMPGSYLPV